MTQKDENRYWKLPKWSVIIGTILGWIGLSGLADGLIEWRQWFEEGWMEHWRWLKAVFSDYAYSYLGVRLPTLLFDYIALGAGLFNVFGRNELGNMVEQNPEVWRTLKRFVPILFAVLWPVVVVLYLWSMFRYVTDSWTDRVTRSGALGMVWLIGREVLLSIVYFLIFLFVASDLIKTFNLSN